MHIQFESLKCHWLNYLWNKYFNFNFCHLQHLASLTFSPFLLSISALLLKLPRQLHSTAGIFLSPKGLRKRGYHHRYCFEITKLFKPNLLLILCNKHDRFLLIISESLSSLNNWWWLRIILESTPSFESSPPWPWSWSSSWKARRTRPARGSLRSTKNPNLMSVHSNFHSFCANLSKCLYVNLGPRVSRLHCLLLWNHDGNTTVAETLEKAEEIFTNPNHPSIIRQTAMAYILPIYVPCFFIQGYK